MNWNAFVHHQVRLRVPPGGKGIDATVGNGRDTAFLLQHCGEVLGFDIQAAAIEAARHRAAGGEPRLRLVRAGHETMLEHARDWRGEVAVVMFNLGYLPGGDKSLVTRPDTTLPALRAALDLLAPGGLVSVVAYPGHFGGAEESEAVEAFLRDLPREAFDATVHRGLNAGPDAPRCFLVQGRRIGAARS